MDMEELVEKSLENALAEGDHEAFRKMNEGFERKGKAKLTRSETINLMKNRTKDYKATKALKHSQSVMEAIEEEPVEVNSDASPAVDDVKAVTFKDPENLEEKSAS